VRKNIKQQFTKCPIHHVQIVDVAGNKKNITVVGELVTWVSLGIFGLVIGYSYPHPVCTLRHSTLYFIV